jgi:hypothetical protein
VLLSEITSPRFDKKSTFPARGFADQAVITGYNTDIEHDGVVYHVQTEDKGLETPLILSLVYTGGAILASKRVLYDDLIEQGFDEAVLAERLQRQHKLICAAIHAGRIEDLRRMSQRDADARAAQTVDPKTLRPEPIIEPEPAESVESSEPPLLATADPVSDSPEWDEDEGDDVTLETPVPAPGEKISYAAVFNRGGDGRTKDVEPAELQILNERVYRAGESVTLNLRLRRLGGTESAIANAPVGVKILGTTFRPVILSAKTDKDGLASISLALPHFTSGRAAILIRAAVKGSTVELRRVIQHR